MRMLKCFIPIIAVLFSICFVGQSKAQTIPYIAFGSNATYSPVTGDYSGFGFGFPMGIHFFDGNVATTPTDDPLVFNWESTAPQLTVGFRSRVSFSVKVSD